MLLVLSRTPGLARLLPGRRFLPRRAGRARRPVGAGVVPRVRRRAVEPQQHAARAAGRLGRARSSPPLGAAADRRRAVRRRHAGDGQLRPGDRVARVPRRPRRVRRRASRCWSLRGLFASPLVGMRLDGAGALRFGLNGAIVATAVALLAFAWSLRGGARDARRQGLLRAAVLGRRPRAAVHVDAAAARRVAAARRRDRRARAAVAARGRAAVRHRARRGVRHAAHLPRLRRRRRSSITGCRPG